MEHLTSPEKAFQTEEQHYSHRRPGLGLHSFRRTQGMRLSGLLALLRGIRVKSGTKNVVGMGLCKEDQSELEM